MRACLHMCWLGFTAKLRYRRDYDEIVACTIALQPQVDGLSSTLSRDASRDRYMRRQLYRENDILSRGRGNDPGEQKYRYRVQFVPTLLRNKVRRYRVRNNLLDRCRIDFEVLTISIRHRFNKSFLTGWSATDLELFSTILFFFLLIAVILEKGKFM